MKPIEVAAEHVGRELEARFGRAQSGDLHKTLIALFHNAELMVKPVAAVESVLVAEASLRKVEQDNARQDRQDEIEANRRAVSKAKLTLADAVIDAYRGEYATRRRTVE